MITNFKTYEKYSNSLYQIGDYILLKDDDVHHRWKVELECYIYEMFYNDGERSYNYHAEGEIAGENKKTVFWLSTSDIDRKMTQEEVKQYKIKKHADKYNL